MSEGRARHVARSSGRKLAARVGIVAVSATMAFGAVAVTESGASSPFLQSINPTGYTGMLGNQTAHTLYILSTESGAKLHCTKGCLKIWPPLLVKSSTKSVTLGAGLKGKIGFVKRSATKKQVTYNSYPVYTYTGDNGLTKQSSGEEVVADGGTWTMANGAATSAAGTPVHPALRSQSIHLYAGTLANLFKHSLYVLSDEAGGSLSCVGACLTVWYPLTVTSKTAPVFTGAGVNGTISFVARGASTYQVMYNTYPVYTYSGDGAPAQSYGEGIASYGGTWYLVKASATTAAATPILPAGA